MTKSGEVIFSHYFNYQAKRSNQPHNDGCRAKEGERGREIQGRKKARERESEREDVVGDVKGGGKKNEKNICIGLAEKYTCRTETKRKHVREGGRDGRQEGEGDKNKTTRMKYLY